MADDDDIIRNRLLTLAGEERDIYLETLLDLYQRSAIDPRHLIDELRRIPADDSAKKKQMANFFRSERGAGYSKAERKQAYDDLLGERTNKELRG